MTPAGGGAEKDSRRGEVRLVPKDLPIDRARALELTPVSRETAERLDRFVATLLAWQQRVNLISRSSEAAIWTRHVAELAAASAARARSPCMGRSGRRRGFSGRRHCLRACGQTRSRGAPRRKQRQESRISPRGSACHRRAGNCTPNAHRGVCGKSGANIRCRDRAGLGSIAPAPADGLSVVEERRARPVSEGSRCRV